jgi:hypothetical protein
VPHMDNVSPDCGYILFKDSKTVIFYSNDLDGMPSEAILDDSNEEAIRICRGLSSIGRWTGNEILTRSTFQVPAPIIGYNMIMNGVGRMDQLRGTNITQQWEKRLYMTMFTMCLDLAVHQAFCLYKAMLPNAEQRNHKTILSFKEKIAQLLVIPVLQKTQLSDVTQ